MSTDAAGAPRTWWLVWDEAQQGMGSLTVKVARFRSLKGAAAEHLP